jgi:hypothetical protein
MANHPKPNGPRSPDQPTHIRLNWDDLRKEPRFWIGIGEVVTDTAMVSVEDWEARLDADFTCIFVSR